MEISKIAKEEMENRIQKIEDFIARKGVGSSYLNRAKKIQRNVNLAIVLGSAITITGIAVWLMNRTDEGEK